MYLAINNFRGARKTGIRSIKACISGSAPLPVEVQEVFERLSRGRLVEGYGLTEASPVTHANPLNGERKLGSIGVPLPSTEAAVVDLTTSRKEVKPGQIGELGRARAAGDAGLLEGSCCDARGFDGRWLAPDRRCGPDG